MMTKTVSALALSTMLCACAGRQPAQIGVVQPQDAAMDCLAIQAEVNSNSARIADLSRESSNKVAQNVAAGVAGLLIWPLWFAMDFQGAADKDTAALQSRQNYLGTLASQRGCATQAAPVPPQSTGHKA